MLTLLRARLMPMHLSTCSAQARLFRRLASQRPASKDHSTRADGRKAGACRATAEDSDLLVFVGTMGSRKEVLVNYLQHDVGLSQKAHVDAIADYVKETVARHSVRTSSAPRGGQITLCVEGNISAGKSTFLADIIEGSKVLKESGTSIVLEPVDKWQRVESFTWHAAKTEPFNILEEFYRDPKRYAYSFQNYVFMTRYLQEIDSRDASIPLRIMERSVFSDKMVFVESVHEKGWMSDMELSLFNAWYDPFVKASPNLVPEGIVYLRTTAETCIRRLNRRARGEETGIELEYLQQLHDKHEAWLCPEGRGMRASVEQLNMDGCVLHELIKDHVHFVNDKRVPDLQHVPTLVLEYDDDLDLDADIDVKNKYRRMVEVFVEYVRKVQSRNERRHLSRSVPSFAEVQGWSAFYDEGE